MKLSLNDKIKYVMFDMDGTLLDTMAYWRNLGPDYLVTKGFAEPTPELFSKLSGGETIEKTNEYLDAVGIPDKISWEGIMPMVRDFYTRAAPLREGMDEILSDLEERGIKKCIVSMTDFSIVKIALSHSGIASRFDFIQGSYDRYFPDKNSPDFYKVILRWFGGEKTEELAVVEDNYNHLLSASLAGCYTVGVADLFEEHRQKAIKELCDEYIPMDIKKQRRYSFDYFEKQK